jgi:hypothetical protein
VSELTGDQPVTRATAPALDGWITLDELAAMIGYSRQGAHYLADTGRIHTLRRLGRRPTYILRESEVPAIRRRLAGDEEERDDRDPDAGDG